MYVWQFWRELLHLLEMVSVKNIGEAEIMLIVLGLIDVVMISNLLIMVIIGGYETFVSRMELNLHPDQPEWLSHVNASVLKIKLAMAIIGISSIHLLRTFIEAGTLGRSGAAYTEAGIMWQALIHAIKLILRTFTEDDTQGVLLLADKEGYLTTMGMNATYHESAAMVSAAHSIFMETAAANDTEVKH